MDRQSAKVEKKTEDNGDEEIEKKKKGKNDKETKL